MLSLNQGGSHSDDPMQSEIRLSGVVVDNTKEALYNSFSDGFVMSEDKYNKDMNHSVSKPNWLNALYCKIAFPEGIIRHGEVQVNGVNFKSLAFWLDPDDVRNGILETYWYLNFPCNPSPQCGVGSVKMSWHQYATMIYDGQLHMVPTSQDSWIEGTVSTTPDIINSSSNDENNNNNQVTTLINQCCDRRCASTATEQHNYSFSFKGSICTGDRWPGFLCIGVKWKENNPTSLCRVTYTI